MRRLIFTLCLLSTCLVSTAVRAELWYCSKYTNYLAQSTQTDRDAMLMAVSSRVVRKFGQIVTRPSATNEDRLWAYKILAIGHEVLAMSPYASPSTARIFKSVADVTTGVIRGKAERSILIPELEELDSKTKRAISRTGAAAYDVFEVHKQDVENLANCIIVLSMDGAKRSDKSQSSAK